MLCYQKLLLISQKTLSGVFPVLCNMPEIPSLHHDGAKQQEETCRVCNRKISVPSLGQRMVRAFLILSPKTCYFFWQRGRNKKMHHRKRGQGRKVGASTHGCNKAYFEITCSSITFGCGETPAPGKNVCAKSKISSDLPKPPS